MKLLLTNITPQRDTSKYATGTTQTFGSMDKSNCCIVVDASSLIIHSTAFYAWYNINAQILYPATFNGVTVLIKNLKNIRRSFSC